MAIHPDHPGIEVTVCMSGEAVVEHLTENDLVDDEDERSVEHKEQCTMTNYIESVTDAKFTINLSLKAPFDLDYQKLVIYTHVDGHFIGCDLIDEEEFRKNKGSWDLKIVGPEEGFRERSKFRVMRFAAIDTSSETLEKSEIDKQTNELISTGEISIDIFRGKIIKRKRKSHTTVLSQLREGKYDEKVHEKALKGDPKSHGVVLGSKRQAPPYTHWEVELLDGEDYPLVVFEFKYRSHKSLQELHVLPHTPSPSPEPQDAPAQQSINIDIQDEERDIPLKSEHIVTPPTISPPASASSSINHQNYTQEKKDKIHQYLLKGHTNPLLINPGGGIQRVTPPLHVPIAVKSEVNDGDKKVNLRGTKRMYKETITIDLTDDWEDAIIVD